MPEDPAVRSRTMAAVKSRNTSVELLLRRALWSGGLRGYRVRSKLPGHPDVVFSRARVAVFVDGCFWHKCPACYRAPKNNAGYWTAKVERNVSRDARVNVALDAMGWKVLRLWEHEVRQDVGSCVSRVVDALSPAKSG